MIIRKAMKTFLCEVVQMRPFLFVINPVNESDYFVLSEIVEGTQVHGPGLAVTRGYSPKFVVCLQVRERGGYDQLLGEILPTKVVDLERDGA